MSGLSLYEITQEIIPLEEELEKAGGEVTEDNRALVIRLEQLELMTRQKIDAYGCYYRSLESLANAINDEEERLNARRRTVIGKMERLKAAAKESMEKRGLVKIEGQIFTVSIQKNGGKAPLKMLVRDEDVPEKYQRKRIEIDREAIRRALADGDTEAKKLAEIEEPGTSLRIR